MPSFRLATLAFLPLVAALAQDVQISTDVGDIVIRLEPQHAPQNVAAFLEFVEARVYDRSSFHATTESSIMGGKPGEFAPEGMSPSGNMTAKNGTQGEFTLPHKKGALVRARTVGDCNPQKTSNSTQFALMLEDSPTGQAEYTAIGYITHGEHVLEAIAESLQQNQDPIPIQHIRILTPAKAD